MSSQTSFTSAARDTMKLMDNEPKQIADIKPSANTQPAGNFQAPSSATPVNAHAQSQGDAGTPMPSSVQSQAVHKAPLEEATPGPTKQSQEKTTTAASNSHAEAIKRAQKNAGGPAIIVTITVILMIVLSALAIFAYLQQNK